MKRNKWSRTGTEGSGSIDKLLEKIGGGPRGRGARRTSKKAKTNVSKTVRQIQQLLEWKMHTPKVSGVGVVWALQPNGKQRECET